jgi:hypothetical protein
MQVLEESRLLQAALVRLGTSMLLSLSKMLRRGVAGRRCFFL